MTDVERLKIRTGENDSRLLFELLESAESIIISRRFPFSNQEAKFESRYNDLKIRIAEDMYNRIGASGQLSHSENGISRSWGAEWVSEQLLNEIIPMVG
ncbi:MAG: hypothetical protein ACI3ZQ_05785 [Candidatus Cryptobacteroides sp.]